MYIKDIFKILFRFVARRPGSHLDVGVTRVNATPLDPKVT